MATRFDTQSNTRQPNTELFTLVELLNKKQPYKELNRLNDPDLKALDNEKHKDEILQRIQGSLVGLAIGDALGASVEFRPNAYLKQHPVKDMQGGGTWGLEAGQWTDDTSMTLCLAASLIAKGRFDPYDQFLRYAQWYRDGYMSSTDKCFDIGKSTRQAITDFERRYRKIRSQLIASNINPRESTFDGMLEHQLCNDGIGLKLGASDSAGNGALMRLAPIPCFFFKSYDAVKKNIDEATQLTHGDERAIDACRFYACLIWLALQGTSKKQLLDPNFTQKYFDRPLHKDILDVVQGSYKNKNGYEGGIRGKGYVVHALEAALWAFHNDGDKFEEGVLKAIDLGDDTDTTAAIYGQLAGAVYGIDKILPRWIEQLYQGEFIKTIAKGLYIKGKQWWDTQPQSERLDKNDPKRRERGANNRERADEKTNETQQTRFPQHTDVTNPSYHSQHSGANSTSSYQDDEKNTVGKPHLITED
jgi:ADP-ribosyl-[dinitrogen reductase] hydrolase